MKSITFFALLSFGIVSCGDNSAGNSKTASDTSRANTGASANIPVTPINSPTDTGGVQGKGTDKIPTRTGTTGQGNTTVTGAATGSPKGTGTDSAK